MRIYPSISVIVNSVRSLNANSDWIYNFLNVTKTPEPDQTAIFGYFMEVMALRRIYTLVPFAFIFSIILFPFTLHSEKGTLIIVYGTSCAGKSTLAKQLVKDLPGNFKVVKKTAIVEKKRRDLIKVITGIKIEKRSELTEAMINLSEPFCSIVKGYHHQVVREKLLEIKELAEGGENIIFDLCMSETSKLDLLDGAQVILVQVYAPISALNIREERRHIKIPRIAVVRQHRRRSMLHGYRLLNQAADDHVEDYIDIVKREDVENFYLPSDHKELSAEFQHMIQEVVRSFQLDQKEQVKVVPATRHDVLVNSGRDSVEESAKKVFNFGVNKGYW